MSKIKKLAGETALYGLGSMLPRVLNFLLVPLHTVNMFSREEYGEITKLLSIVAFLNVVYTFGMETAFFRFATKPGADSKKAFDLAQTCVVIISVILSATFILFANVLTPSLGLEEHPELIGWITAIMFIDGVVAIPFANLRLQKKALRFALFKIVNVIFLILLNFYFLKVSYDPSVGIGFVFLANLIANSLFLIFFARTLIHWRPSWDNAVSPGMLQYAYPVMLTGLAGMTNEMFSRLTLDWWLPKDFYGIPNAAALGIFGACYKFAVFMNLGIQAFRYAAEPFFFSNAQDKNSPELFAKVNHYFVIAGAFVLLTLSVNLDVLKYFIGPEFWEGLHIVPVLLLAYLFLGIYYNVSIWFKLTDKTYMGTLITAGGAFVTVLANYLLIPTFGYMGSSWAAVACYGGMMIACYLLGKKFFPVPYKVASGTAYIFFSIALILVSTQVRLGSSLSTFAFHQVLLGFFVAVVYWRERRAWRNEFS